VIIGVKTIHQLEQNLVSATSDLPEEVRTALEEKSRPQEEYMTWYNKLNSDRFKKASE
jgi:aryl-alcohol dehydrogenase-like predicted oxidoreductase